MTRTLFGNSRAEWQSQRPTCQVEKWNIKMAPAFRVVQSKVDDLYQLRVILFWDFGCGSKLRMINAIKKASLLLRQFGSRAEYYQGELRAEFASPTDAEVARSRLVKLLERCAKRPMEPLEVEDALGITAAERRRWTKAMLLPTSGEGSFSAGRKIRVPHYRSDAIAQLAMEPETIARWRALEASAKKAKSSDRSENKN